MATLPSYVTVLRQGFEERRGTGALVRSQMESGPAKQRRVQQRTMVTRPVQLLIRSNADYQSFIEWVRDDLEGGANWFDMTDPVDGTTKAARIVNGEYVAQPVVAVDVWQLSLTLETWE